MPGFLASNTKCVLRVSSSGNAILDHSFCCMPWGVNQIRLLICIIALLHLFSPLFCYSLFKFHLILKSCIRTIFHFFGWTLCSFLTISDHIAYLKLFTLKPSINLKQRHHSFENFRIFEFPKIWKTALRIFQNFRKASFQFRILLSKVCKTIFRCFNFWGKVRIGMIH